MGSWIWCIASFSKYFEQSPLKFQMGKTVLLIRILKMGQYMSGFWPPHTVIPLDICFWSDVSKLFSTSFNHSWLFKGLRISVWVLFFSSWSFFNLSLFSQLGFLMLSFRQSSDCSTFLLSYFLIPILPLLFTDNSRASIGNYFVLFLSNNQVDGVFSILLSQSICSKMLWFLNYMVLDSSLS